MEITYSYSLTRSAAHILLINSRLWTKIVHKYHKTSNRSRVSNSNRVSNTSRGSKLYVLLEARLLLEVLWYTTF